jgi:hypothetical protein
VTGFAVVDPDAAGLHSPCPASGIALPLTVFAKKTALHDAAHRPLYKKIHVKMLASGLIFFKRFLSFTP